MDVTMDKEEITLNLLIERVSKLDVHGICRARLLSLTANFAGLANLRNEVQNILRNTGFVKKSLHGVLSCMPPLCM
jgi:hypothetical protein